MTAAKRLGIVRGTDEWNQHRYFRNSIILKWKTENVILCGRGFAFVSTRNERLWVHSKLIEIRFGQARPSEILSKDIKK